MASVTQLSLARIIELVKNNEIRIPIFQREFVWNPGQVLDLLESIRTGIPLGAIVLWKVPTRYESLFENYFGAAAPRGGIKAIVSSNEWAVTTIPSGDVVFSNNPNSFEGILDGRQRTQSLLMTIGGVTNGHTSNPHAKLYYLDLTKPFKGTETPFGTVRVSEAETGGSYDTLSKWIADGKFPLWYSHPNYFIGQLSQAAHYAGNTPGDVDSRIEQLSAYLNSLSASNLGVITIDSTYDLSQVCNIFETLNITGTKVSAFDITCSKLIGSAGTKKPFQLRERLSDISKGEIAPGFNFPFLKRWCEDSNKWSVISQAITMMYLLSDTAKANYPPTATVDSIKGEALINTPEMFYRHLFDYGDDGSDIANLPSLSQLEEFASDLYATTNGCYSMKSCPYPVLLTQYFSLRYKQSSDVSAITVPMINDVFRVFYWRTSATTRYDQGFLTRAVTDTNNIWTFLAKGDNSTVYTTDKLTWWNRLEVEFTNWNIRLQKPTNDDLNQDLSSSNSGAKAKMFNALLFVKRPRDLKSDSILEAKDNIELHHIFPKSWVRNNANTELNLKRLAYPTAIVPLSRDSNVEWLAAAPEQVIANWHNNPNWQALGNLFQSVLIDETAYASLLNTNSNTPDVRLETFFDSRLITMRNTLQLLMDTRDLPLDLRY